MYPEIDLGFVEIPTYWIMNIIGVIVGYLVFKRNNLKNKNYNLKKEDLLYFTVYLMIGAILGARVLFIITYLPAIIDDFSVLFNVLLSGGSVFYGGVIGGLIGGLIYIKNYGVNPGKAFNLLAISIPLGHFFGRIGCFLAGCCYGEHTDSIFGVIFPEGPVHAVATGPVHPTQLYEAFFNLMLFLFLFYLFTKWKKHKPYIFTGLYLVFYSTFRFFIEFIRGDSYRGIWILSTSQWISLVAFLIGLYIIFKDLEKFKFFRQTKPKSKSYVSYLKRTGKYDELFGSLEE